MIKILLCDYCEKEIKKGLTIEGNKSYHPNCYILKDKDTYPILFGSYWKRIHAIKFTENKKEHKKCDVLLESKDGRIFIVHNWKRVYCKRGKTYHSWHYDVYENNKFIIDGEYETDDFRQAQRSDMLGVVINYIKIEVLEK